MNNTFDSEYSIQKQILNKVGGDGNKRFDSQYSILLEILDKIQGGGGGGAVIDDETISTTTAWSSSKIVSELAEVGGFGIEIVEELPEIGDPHTIYFVPSVDPQTANTYDEYMYISGDWEQVGSTAIDLSNYATLNDISTFITANDVSIYAEKTYVDASLDLKANASDLTSYATIANVDASLALKANSSDLANYATIANVDASLALKADASDLASYATITNVDASLALKADKTYVDSSLDLKANASDLASYATIANVDASLALKADSTDLASYATIANVDASLALKQDVLTAGTNITITNNVISATGGSGGSSIDDQNVSTNTTYSSSKIESELEDRPEYVELTQAQYDVLPAAQKTNSSVYVITDATVVDPSSFYTKSEADAAFNPKNTTTANSGSYKFPNWNANGQITGQASQAYQSTLTVNGSDKTLYATGSGNMPSIYAPTSAGTSGQYLVSSGSGAPVWQALEVASDYVIADADASAGTYSSDVSAFYNKTISENVVQGVQIKIVDEHVVDNASVYSDSYYLPSSSRIYEGNVELWLMYTEDGKTWENRHYLITNQAITRDISTGIFGYADATTQQLVNQILS